MKQLWNWLNTPFRLEEVITNRNRNNFDVIRHFAALTVIYMHCALFSGASEVWGAFGVPVFFFLSGLLVSQSFETSSSVKNFLWRRFLRIYPAAVVVILVCALVMGPMVTVFTYRDYFTSPVFWKNISSVFLVRIYFDLPGVFQHSLLGTPVNSCLWTLPLEIKMYLFTLAWGLIGFRKKNLLLALVVLLLIIIGANCSVQVQAFLRQKLYLASFKIAPYTSVVPLYLLGMLSYSYRKKIVVKPYWFFVALLLLLLLKNFSFFSYLFHSCIAVITLGFAVFTVKWLPKTALPFDFSYGLYLYGFPVEQLFLHYAYPSINGFSLFLLVVLTTLILAFLSWHFVEKRALQFRNYVR